jgi:HEAT repeat protein
VTLVAQGDESVHRLFQARSRGDTGYLIEALRLEPEHAVLSAKWLADDGVEAAIPALVRLLDAADPSARFAAVKALDRLGLPHEVKARLVEIAQTDADDGVRSWAASALGSYRDRELTPLLVSLLADRSWLVSSAAALALGKQEDASALEPLRRAQRAIRRSPARFYLYRRVYADAVRALRKAEPQ